MLFIALLVLQGWLLYFGTLYSCQAGTEALVGGPKETVLVAARTNRCFAINLI